MPDAEVFDCIVVGAGIEGSATAYELSCRSINVLLLDQFSLPHTKGSSHGATRITRRAYNKPEYMEMMKFCFEKWKELETLAGETLYKQTGLLTIGPATADHFNTIKVAMNTNDIQHEILTSAALSNKFPGLKFPSHYEAILEYDAGTLRADRFLSIYQTQFVKNGGRISVEEKINQVIPGEVVKLITSKGSRLAKNVVFCLGPWTGEFFQQQLQLTLPLECRVIKVCFWREKQSGFYSAKAGFPCLFIEVDSKDQYFGAVGDECEHEGFLKFCYHSGPVANPDHKDSPDAQYCIDKCRKFISKHMPLLESEPAITETCLYTVTPDYDFILDRHPEYHNVVFGAGFSGHGFKLAPAVGQMLTDLVCNVQLSSNKDLFLLKRFHRNDKPSQK